MLSEHSQDWLVARIDVPFNLQAALRVSGVGERCQRVVVLDALAGDLGLETDRLGDGGYDLLEALLYPLSDLLAARAATPDTEQRRLRQITDDAISPFSLEDLIEISAQFGWDAHQLGTQPLEVRQVADALSRFFAGKLTQRSSIALRQWQKERPAPARRHRPA